MRMSDDEAYSTFKAMRWEATGGKPVCPRCGCTEAYEARTRKIFKCQLCTYQFSVTSGTIFASRKLPIRDLLAGIALFVTGAKGKSSLQMSRELDVTVKTAFVLCHKLREAMKAAEDATPLQGRVEIDGAYYGGYVKPANKAKNRVDRRKALYQNDKRKVVVVMRERGGRARSVIADSEGGAVPAILQAVQRDAILYTDEANSWFLLDGEFDKKRRIIAHAKAYANGPISTNLAESFHSRMRRSEIGVHHHIAGPYLGAYAAEADWRENNRRVSAGGQYRSLISAAASAPVSRQWKGYWQRRDETNKKEAAQAERKAA